PRRRQYVLRLLQCQVGQRRRRRCRDGRPARQRPDRPHRHPARRRADGPAGYIVRQELDVGRDRDHDQQAGDRPVLRHRLCQLWRAQRPQRQCHRVRADQRSGRAARLRLCTGAGRQGPLC
ncbi:hypothetical protein LTR94_034762, partial [Friedmanniomyces endolithicus]